MAKSTDAEATRGGERGDGPIGGGWRAPVAVAAAVLLASVLPVPGEAPADPGVVGLTDPFHLLGYAALAAALTGPIGRALRDRMRFRGGNRLAGTIGPESLAAAVAGVFAVLAATAFGLGVEVVQAPLPWRSFALADAAVNAAGALIGAGLAVGWRMRAGDSDGDRDRDRAGGPDGDPGRNRDGDPDRDRNRP